MRLKTKRTNWYKIVESSKANMTKPIVTEQRENTTLASCRFGIVSAPSSSASQSTSIENVSITKSFLARVLRMM